MKLSLGVLTSHPIQYQAPLFRELAKRVDLQVYFAHLQTPEGQAAAGFGSEFEWDIDLLGGYSHEFLENRATRPDVSRFFGCDTPEIRDRIASGNYDSFLVMGWALKCYWQAVSACRLYGVPVMVRGDSQLSTVRSHVKRAIKALVYPKALARFDACLYVGKRNRQYLEHYGVEETRMFHSPHCVDNDWFRRQASVSNSSEIRHSLGIGPDEVMLLFVGKLVPIKRPADLLNASALLTDSAKKIHCVFAGAGELESKLKALAERRKVSATFLGFVNQTALPALYHAADLVVMPSERETWGLVANESLACGTPVLVSDACGCAPDLVEKTGAGACFPAGDIVELARTIGDLLEDRPEAVAISMLAESHSLERAADGIIAAAQQLSRVRGGHAR